LNAGEKNALYIPEECMLPMK